MWESATYCIEGIPRLPQGESIEDLPGSCHYQAHSAILASSHTERTVQ